MKNMTKFYAFKMTLYYYFFNLSYYIILFFKYIIKQRNKTGKDLLEIFPDKQKLDRYNLLETLNLHCYFRHNFV